MNGYDNVPWYISVPFLPHQTPHQTNDIQLTPEMSFCRKKKAAAKQGLRGEWERGQLQQVRMEMFL